MNIKKDNLSFFLSLADWDSSKIFRPLNERVQEEEEEDIYHIVHNYDLHNNKGDIILGQDGGNYKSTERDHIVSIRRVSRHRKGANLNRSSSQAGNKGTSLNGRRPYSMSCLVAPNLKNPYQYSNISSPFYENEDNSGDIPCGN